MNIAGQSMHLTPKIEQALSSRRYKNAERIAIGLHVSPEDRVLDPSGGIVCTWVVAGKIVGGENLMIVEVNADLGCEIMESLAANDVTGSQLIHTAVVAHEAIGHIRF
jgi:hypothetical protein